MSIVNNTEGSGNKSTGTVVYRKSGERTLVNVKPAHYEKAGSHGSNMHDAVRYASRQMADATARNTYERDTCEKTTGFHTALADYMNPPHIAEIDLTQYKGNRGDVIFIKATDDFKVTAVQVAIEDKRGVLLECGNALQQENEGYWIYLTTRRNTFLKGCRVIIRALDLPGNESRQEQVL